MPLADVHSSEDIVRTAGKGRQICILSDKSNEMDGTVILISYI